LFIIAVIITVVIILIFIIVIFFFLSPSSPLPARCHRVWLLVGIRFFPCGDLEYPRLPVMLSALLMNGKMVRGWGEGELEWEKK
jgi:hypothetical protein